MGQWWISSPRNSSRVYSRRTSLILGAIVSWVALDHSEYMYLNERHSSISMEWLLTEYSERYLVEWVSITESILTSSIRVYRTGYYYRTGFTVTSVFSHWPPVRPLFFLYINAIPPGWLGGRFTPVLKRFLWFPFRAAHYLEIDRGFCFVFFFTLGMKDVNIS